MATNRLATSLTWCIATTILISAFLVFQVQPIISKSILPWFGGSPAVWSTCMLFFQGLLFAGYAYAHASTQWLKPAGQGAVHVALIFLALLSLPISPQEAWRPQVGDDPTMYILLLLGAHVGLPFFLLSSTGPLLQSWFSQALSGRSPYRLYALSNAGSLAALLTYPFLFEPAFTSHGQAAIWSLGFCAFGLVCGWTALRIRHLPAQMIHGGLSPDSAGGTEPSAIDRAMWLALPAFASVLLLATTNHVCQDVAVIPFLWIAPLSLYLLTFIICFDKSAWYSRRFCGLGAVVACLLICTIESTRFTHNLFVEVGVYLAAMYFLCMLCHGELVRMKPIPRYLTSFYLRCSAGGALGGLFVAIVCPLIFTSFLEMNLCLFIGYIAAAAIWIAESRRTWMVGHWLRFAAVAAIVGGIVVLRVQAAPLRETPLEAARNFYGVLRVHQGFDDDPLLARRVLFHGRISHGAQFLHPDRRHLPTAYYGTQSGVGMTLNIRRQKGPIRVGVVGLGVGTLATYARDGDYYRLYEINPDVIALARRHFTFLADAAGDTDVVQGDARLSMDSEAPQHFDVLVLDAFSGDAIPTHLLTREAFKLYLRHIKADGVIAVHITNRHVNLAPVMRQMAAHFDLSILETGSKANPDMAIESAHWVMLTRNEEFVGDDDFAPILVSSNDHDAALPLWTDQYNNLFDVLR